MLTALNCGFGRGICRCHMINPNLRCQASAKHFPAALAPSVENCLSIPTTPTLNIPAFSNPPNCNLKLEKRMLSAAWCSQQTQELPPRAASKVFPAALRSVLVATTLETTRVHTLSSPLCAQCVVYTITDHLTRRWISWWPPSVDWPGYGRLFLNLY